MLKSKDRNDVYTLDYVPGFIKIQKNDYLPRLYKVVTDEKREFIISVKKTHVKAIDGAEGLYKFFEKEQAKDSCRIEFFVWAEKILEHTKPVPLKYEFAFDGSKLSETKMREWYNDEHQNYPENEFPYDSYDAFVSEKLASGIVRIV